jgi:hypothetical protein
MTKQERTQDKQKSELTDNGIKVSVTRIGGKAEVVINDLTMHGSDGITITAHTIMQGYRSKEL